MERRGAVVCSCVALTPTLSRRERGLIGVGLSRRGGPLFSPMERSGAVVCSCIALTPTLSGGRGGGLALVCPIAVGHFYSPGG